MKHDSLNVQDLKTSNYYENHIYYLTTENLYDNINWHDIRVIYVDEKLKDNYHWIKLKSEEIYKKHRRITICYCTI